MSPAEKRSPLFHQLVVYLLFLILLLPLLGTLLYSLSTSWSASILPSGLTFKWYLALWSDARFLAAFGRSLLGLRRNPIILAIVAGVTLALLDLRLPPLLAKPVAMLGTASAPVALFVIGGSLVGLPLRSMLRDVSILASGKLLLHPLLVAGALLLFGPLDPHLAMAGVLIAAMPMLSIFPILGQRHDMQGFCAATLLLATTSSFLTISAAIWLLQHYPFFH